MTEIRCRNTWRWTCLLTKGMLYLCWCLCPCWSSCSWSCVQVEWVALELVVWIFWYDWRCPRWRAGAVVSAVSLLMRQLQIVLNVGTAPSVELLTVKLRRHAIDFVDVCCVKLRADVMRDVDLGADAAERWLRNRFVEFSRCWCWLMYPDARNNMKLFAWRLKYSVDVLKLKSCCPLSKLLPCPL